MAAFAVSVPVSIAARSAPIGGPAKLGIRNVSRGAVGPSDRSTTRFFVSASSSQSNDNASATNGSAPAASDSIDFMSMVKDTGRKHFSIVEERKKKQAAAGIAAPPAPAAVADPFLRRRVADLTAEEALPKPPAPAEEAPEAEGAVPESSAAEEGGLDFRALARASSPTRKFSIVEQKKKEQEERAAREAAMPPRPKVEPRPLTVFLEPSDAMPGDFGYATRSEAGAAEAPAEAPAAPEAVADAKEPAAPAKPEASGEVDWSAAARDLTRRRF